MRTFLLSVFVYMAFNYVEYALLLLVCGNEFFDTWYEEHKEYFEVSLLIRIGRLMKFYITVGFIMIPVTIVLMIDHFLRK